MMEDIKLFDLLKELSIAELKALREYIHSPLFNKSKHLCTLYDFLVDKKYFRLLSRGIDKQSIWKKLYKNLKYEDVKLRRAFSDLAKLIEDFMAFSIYQTQEESQKNYLLKAYHKKQNEKYFYQAIKNSFQLLEKKTCRNAEHYYNRFIYQSTVNLYAEKKAERSVNINIEKTDESLDIFYIINKLKHYCEILNYKSIVNVDYKLLLLDEILEHIRNHSYDHIPAIQIYYTILKSLKKDDNERHFLELKKLLSQHIDLFSPEESKVMYGYAFNYCIRRINMGKTKYLNEIFSLYKTTLDNSLILDKGYLSPWDYKNIVATALRLKEFKWTENFINEYKEHISRQFKENAYTYNYARLQFEKKQYPNVLQLLQNVEYEDIFYSLDTRSLLLKTYYELNDWISIDYFFESFSQYLRRNKFISDNHRNNYLNLIKLSRMLVKAKENKSITAEEIKLELTSLKQIADKTWLEEKIDAI